MERYRIIQREGYNGCIPIIIYWVQVRKDKRISSEWDEFEDDSEVKNKADLKRLKVKK